MNLNTIAEVKRPTSADQVAQWRNGYARQRRLAVLGAVRDNIIDFASRDAGVAPRRLMPR